MHTLQNRELLARQKYCRRGADLTQTTYKSTACHCCQKKANLILGLIEWSFTQDAGR